MEKLRNPYGAAGSSVFDTRQRLDDGPRLLGFSNRHADGHASIRKAELWNYLLK